MTDKNVYFKDQESFEIKMAQDLFDIDIEQDSFVVDVCDDTKGPFLVELVNDSFTVEMDNIQQDVREDMDHDHLYNRDKENQHPISSITGLQEALLIKNSWSELQNKPFESIGDNLSVVNGVLKVDTAPNVEQDNTKPITSAAVYTEVGNINALLSLI